MRVKVYFDNGLIRDYNDVIDIDFSVTGDRWIYVYKNDGSTAYLVKSKVVDIEVIKEETDNEV